MVDELKPKKHIKSEKVPMGVKGLPKIIWAILGGAMLVISFVIEVFSTNYPTYILIGLAAIIVACAVCLVLYSLNKQRKQLLKKYNQLVTEYNTLLNEYNTIKSKLSETEDELGETRSQLTIIEDELERTKAILAKVEKELSHHKIAEIKPVFSSGANRFSHWVFWYKYKVWFKNVGNGPAKNINGICIYHTNKTDRRRAIQIDAMQSGQHHEFFAGNSKEYEDCTMITLEFSYEDTYGNKETHLKKLTF